MTSFNISKLSIKIPLQILSIYFLSDISCRFEKTLTENNYSENQKYQIFYLSNSLFNCMKRRSIPLGLKVNNRRLKNNLYASKNNVQ